MKPCSHKPGDMRDIHHQHRADLIGNLPELLEINGSGIGGRARHNHFRSALQCNLSHIIVIEESVVIDAIRHTLEILAGHIDR